MRTPTSAILVLVTTTLALPSIASTRKNSSDQIIVEPNFGMVVEDEIYELFEKSPQSFDRAAVSDPVSQIVTDLYNLKFNHNVPSSDDKIAKRWSLKDTSSHSWATFLHTRVKVITHGNHTQKSFWEKRFKVQRQYKTNSDKVLFTEKPSTNNIPDVVASNVTTQLMALNQKNGLALQYKNQKFPGLAFGMHFGVVTVGTEFFTTSIFKVDDTSNRRHGLYSFVGSVYRNSILLHEARHSDGNGINTGFPHAACPDGHILASDTPGVLNTICDRSTNGPHAIAADYLLLHIRQCQENSKKDKSYHCSKNEISVLEGLYLENYARIIDPEEHNTDGNGNPVVIELDPTPFEFSGVPKVKFQ